MSSCGPRPKKPMSSYLLWLNFSGRMQIKSEQPELSVKEVAVKGGELWRSMSVEEKAFWQKSASVAMEKYKEELGQWNCQAGAGLQNQQFVLSCSQCSDGDNDPSSSQLLDVSGSSLVMNNNQNQRIKKPVSSYLLWLNSSGRREIKLKQPELGFKEVAVKGGELWRSMSAEDKAFWQETATAAMERYKDDVELQKCQKKLSAYIYKNR
ncbi:FACT complex subunit Ssrp1-like [Drosophila eugracilis]|uniref:FACT complex subunit Ssrp1-like n=1 Tax=Drosophila eugracilis TaxID=29029 RepID=UPI0007E88EA5|nr:FACT complex subunit Ssrp1-like [Drosophila eugracilis]